MNGFDTDSSGQGGFSIRYSGRRLLVSKIGFLLLYLVRWKHTMQGSFGSC